jgi:hypothetical protein
MKKIKYRTEYNFYTVSLRTFVISFYFGSGSAKAKIAEPYPQHCLGPVIISTYERTQICDN